MGPDLVFTSILWILGTGMVEIESRSFGSFLLPEGQENENGKPAKNNETLKIITVWNMTQTHTGCPNLGLTS